MSSEMNVQYLSGQRYGKTYEQVSFMLNKFDPNIHDKIKIEIVACGEIQHLKEQLKVKDELLREAVKLIENAETQYITYEPNRWSDFLNKPEIKALRGE